MLKLRKISVGIIFLTLTAVFLAACGRSEATPTTAPEVIYTEAAQTVQAGLTQTAMAMPSATATVTEMPTRTPEPTQAASPTTSGLPTNTLPPTAAVPSVPDKAEWVTQVPADGTTMTPDQPFTLVWTVKNVGTTTWTTAYQVRYFLGDTTLRFGSSDIRFPKEVKPNESVDLTLSMKAPNRAGDFTTIWVLTNADGANFYTLTLNIKVAGAAATSTQTTAPEPTQTMTPTVTETP